MASIAECLCPNSAAAMKLSLRHVLLHCAGYLLKNGRQRRNDHQLSDELEEDPVHGFGKFITSQKWAISTYIHIHIYIYLYIIIFSIHVYTAVHMYICVCVYIGR